MLNRLLYNYLIYYEIDRGHPTVVSKRNKNLQVTLLHPISLGDLEEIYGRIVRSQGVEIGDITIKNIIQLATTQEFEGADGNH